MIEDEKVRRIRTVRKKLLEEHGGFDNYFKYLQKLDREYFAAKKSGKRRSSSSKSKSTAQPNRRSV